MPAIDVGDLLTQIIAALVAGLLLLVIQPGWLRRPTPPASSVSDIKNPSSGGNQAVVQRNSVGGDVNVGQHYTDNSQTTRITNNVNSASGTPASEDGWVKLILVLVAGVFVAGMFALFWPHLQGVSYGLVIAVVIMLAVAIRRTRQLRAWSARATIITILAVATLLVTCVAWAGISSLEREGISIAGVADEIGSLAADQRERGLPGYLDFFTGSVVPVILDGDRPIAMFVLFLALGAAASVALTIFVWLRVLEWHAFLEFSVPGKQREKVAVRAKNFVEEGRGYRMVLGGISLAAIALGCALGYVFDLWHWAVDST